jgi:putative ABC transport system permease protein
VETTAGSDDIVTHNPAYDQLHLVAYTFIAALVALALVNAILVAWTNALDSTRNSALFRAPGRHLPADHRRAHRRRHAAALAAVLVGVPLGLAVYATAASASGGAGVSRHRSHPEKLPSNKM